jgi:hypothetical protein
MGVHPVINNTTAKAQPSASSTSVPALGRDLMNRPLFGEMPTLEYVVFPSPSTLG